MSERDMSTDMSHAGRDGEVILCFDGASRGNPGPSAAGVVVMTPDGQVLRRRGIALADGTNNVAEYKGLLNGLETCAELGARRVHVRSDSELVIRQMTGVYRVRNERLRWLFEKVRQRVADFEEITFEAVPRERNTCADKLCNLVFKLGRSFSDDVDELPDL